MQTARPAPIMIVVSLAVLALMVAACGGGGASAPTLPGTSWDIVTINDREPVAGSEPTIAFGTDGTASGSTGCNQFNGTFTTDGGSITFGPLATTRMACDDALNAQEQVVLETIQDATNWAIDGGNLSLSGEKMLLGKPAS